MAWATLGPAHSVLPARVVRDATPGPPQAETADPDDASSGRERSLRAALGSCCGASDGGLILRPSRPATDDDALPERGVELRAGLPVPDCEPDASRPPFRHAASAEGCDATETETLMISTSRAARADTAPVPPCCMEAVPIAPVPDVLRNRSACRQVLPGPGAAPGNDTPDDGRTKARTLGEAVLGPAGHLHRAASCRDRDTRRRLGLIGLPGLGGHLWSRDARARSTDYPRRRSLWAAQRAGCTPAFSVGPGFAVPPEPAAVPRMMLVTC